MEDSRIRRAPSAFNLYFKTAFPALRIASPEAKISTFMGTVASQWKSLSPESKAPFIQEADKLKAVVASKR